MCTDFSDFRLYVDDTSICINVHECRETDDLWHPIIKQYAHDECEWLVKWISSTENEWNYMKWTKL